MSDGGARRAVPSLRARRPLLLLAGAVILVGLLARRIAGFYTEVLWFDSVGFGRVFWTLLGTRVALGAVAALVMAVFVWLNLRWMRRTRPAFRPVTPQEEVVERYRELFEPYLGPLSIVAALVAGALAAAWVADAWPTFLLWRNAVPFGLNDPHFGRDVGWFVFSLPFQLLVNGWLTGVVILTLLITAGAGYLLGSIRPQAPGMRITPGASAHLSALLAGLVALIGWRFYLFQYRLSYSERGEVTGLSYTDVHAQLPAYRLLIVIAAVCVILFLINVRNRGWILPAAGAGILVVAAVVLAGAYPAIVQRLQVEPQERERERPYIARNLELTRFGFGLDDVRVEAFPARAELSAAQVEDNTPTLEAIRLWDPATLQSAYRQLQVFRTYYDFVDVDVDRYEVEGQPRQVMFAVREINENDLPSSTWQNKRLFFTHGYGHVASSTSAASPQGQPRFLIDDIPPEGEPALEIDNPRIYFGERSPLYSIVGATEPELDYPLSGEAATDAVPFSYDGADGVEVGSLGRRLGFALRFAEPNFVLSDLIQPDSKVLYHRNIRERVTKVAPFLKLDHDPYPVATGGRIAWIQDAYLVTDMLPYSERVELGPLTVADQRRFVTEPGPDGTLVLRERLLSIPGIEGRANYIRNSVKAVVDAYDGTVTLYAMDDADPLLQSWRNAFPDIFTPIADAPEDLRKHLRYPEDMFRVQAALYTTYHIPTPDAFYTKEDRWAIPVDAATVANRGGSGGAADLLRPYYLLMRLPGEESEEFALIQPYNPARRQNLIGWLAGRSDGENYGELKAFVMPPNRTVFGPEQVQARINQDSAVSEQVTLWNQAGSKVIYGNLLVIPIEDSLLYVQPLFLRSEQSEIPELKKVVMVFGDSVIMEDTLAGALASTFGAAPELDDGVEEPGDATGTPGGPSGPTLDPRVRALVNEALGHFAAAEEALREGDLGTYREETQAAEDALARADRLLGGSGTATPSPSPSPAATPPPTATEEPAG